MRKTKEHLGLLTAAAFALTACLILPDGLAADSATKLTHVLRPASLATVYDVKAFGARGDRKTLDTGAINKAIEAAALAGGGTVLIPAGTYLCFSIRLKSN